MDLTLHWGRPWVEVVSSVWHPYLQLLARRESSRGRKGFDAVSVAHHQFIREFQHEARVTIRGFGFEAPRHES